MTSRDDLERLQALSDQIATALGSDPNDFVVVVDRRNSTKTWYSTVDVTCGKRLMWSDFERTEQRMLRAIERLAARAARSAPAPDGDA